MCLWFVFWVGGWSRKGSCSAGAAQDRGWLGCWWWKRRCWVTGNGSNVPSHPLILLPWPPAPVDARAALVLSLLPLARALQAKASKQEQGPAVSWARGPTQSSPFVRRGLASVFVEGFLAFFFVWAAAQLGLAPRGRVRAVCGHVRGGVLCGGVVGRRDLSRRRNERPPSSRRSHDHTHPCPSPTHKPVHNAWPTHTAGPSCGVSPKGLLACLQGSSSTSLLPLPPSLCVHAHTHREGRPCSDGERAPPFRHAHTDTTVSLRPRTPPHKCAIPTTSPTKHSPFPSHTTPQQTHNSQSTTPRPRHSTHPPTHPLSPFSHWWCVNVL